MKRFLMTILCGQVANIPWCLFVWATFPNGWKYGALAGGVGAIFGMIGGGWYMRRNPL